MDHPRRQIVLAAILARTNMGQPLPDQHTVNRMLRDPRLTLRKASDTVNQTNIESDTLAAMFYEETQAGYGRIAATTIADMLDAHTAGPFANGALEHLMMRPSNPTEADKGLPCYHNDVFGRCQSSQCHIWTEEEINEDN